MVTINPEELKINQSFTADMEHIGKLAELKQRTGKNVSKIIREAIDEYYAKYAGEQQPEQAERENQ